MKAHDKHSSMLSACDGLTVERSELHNTPASCGVMSSKDDVSGGRGVARSSSAVQYLSLDFRDDDMDCGADVELCVDSPTETNECMQGEACAKLCVALPCHDRNRCRLTTSTRACSVLVTG